MKNSLILVFIILLFSSCGTYYYYPTYQNTPTNTKEKEIKGSYFISAYNQGFNISYSLTKNIGTFLCINTFNNYNFSTGAEIADLGLYYFKSEDIDENKNLKIIYSISAAYGYGQNNRHHDFFNLDINRIFIQPSFAITSKFVDFGISSKFSYVNYKIDRIVSEQYSNHFADLHDVGKQQFHFIEPHIYFGLGYKGIKLNYHIVNTHKMNDSEILYYNNVIGYLSLSLKFDIDKIFK